MKNKTSIRRIVPNIYSNQLEKSKQFYTGFLEMELAMDMGWILTFISKENTTAQISIFRNEKIPRWTTRQYFYQLKCRI